MYSYESLKEDHGVKISRTIDSPIVVFDYFELSEVFGALFVILIFGVIFYSWSSMFFFLGIVLGVAPQVRRRHPKGVFLHWPYRKLYMFLPGLINPKGPRRFSD